MAIKLKRSSTPGNIPSTSALALGELALNTYDGNIYFKQNQGGAESIVTISPTQAGTTLPADAQGYLYDDGAGNLSWQPVTAGVSSLSTLTDSVSTLTLNYGALIIQSPANLFSIQDSANQNQISSIGNSSISISVGNSSTYFNADGSVSFPYYSFPGYTGTVRSSLISLTNGFLDWGYPSAISNGTATVYMDAFGDIRLPSGTDIFDSSGALYRGINIQDNAVAISTASLTLNFGTGLIVANDPITNITSINVDPALSAVSTLNVAGDAKVGGNFTVTGGIFAIGTVYSNGVPVLTGQIQADWNQTDYTNPSYINNKPTLITTILYTKQLNYVGTIQAQTGVLRWYPDTNIAITNVFLTSATAPSTTDFVVNILKNGSIVGSVTQSIGTYKSPTSTLNISVTTADYITVDVLSAGLASNGSLTVSYTRVP